MLGSVYRRGRRPPENPQISIIHKCQDYLVVNKPYDVRIDGDHDHTVEKMIKSLYPEIEKPRLIHQLDYATSGIMCWGLNKKATAAASKLFSDRKVSKTYLALVKGRMPENQIYTFTWPIADDPNDEFKMAIGTTENPGKEAKTTAQIVSYAKFSGEDVTKVALQLHTGRRHQLRVHLKQAGYPIIGDATYTDDEQTFRMMLHSWKLTLPLPTGTLSFITPDPFTELVEDEIMFVSTKSNEMSEHSENQLTSTTLKTSETQNKNIRTENELTNTNDVVDDEKNNSKRQKYEK